MRARQHLWPRASLGLLAALALAYLVWNALAFWPYTTDDAYISLRYARHLTSGAGLVYNPGERVEGFSNFTWVLLAAAVSKCGLSVLPILKIVGLACALATAGLTFRFLRPLGGPLVALAALVLFAVNTSVAVWSQSGLEMSLYALLVLLACARFELEVSGSRRPLSALLFALAWLSRPDAPVYLLYFVVRRLVEVRRRPFDRADLAWAATLLAVVVPYEAFGLWYYGHVLPHTHAAKVGDVGGRLHALRPDGVLPLFLSTQGWGLLVLLAVGATGCGLRRRCPLPLWLPIACGLVFVVYAQKDWMPRHRFMVPILPFLFGAIAYGAAGWLERLRSAPAARAAVAVVLLAAFGDYAVQQSVAEYPEGPRNLATRARGPWWSDVAAGLGPLRRDGRPQVWSVLLDAPPETRVVARDIGYLGWVAENPVFDLGGLVTASVARYRRNPSDETQRALLDDLFGNPPSLVPDLRRGSWFDELLLADPRTTELYQRAEQGKNVVYRLRERAPFDPRERVRRAMELAPEFRSAGEAFLR